MDRLTRLERKAETAGRRVDIHDMSRNPYAGHSCEWYFSGEGEPERGDTHARGQFAAAMLDAVLSDRWEGKPV